MGNPGFIDRTSFARQTILLAEDNEDDVVIMRAALEKAGIKNPVQVVADGEQALAYLRGEGEYADRAKHPLPIMLLLDLKMPKRTGLEVIEWIRHNDALKRLTVHILSASTRAADVTRAAELGANAYLIKPSRYDDLVAMLAAWNQLAQYQALPAASEV